jgi:S1-C subfamily serine protease
MVSAALLTAPLATPATAEPLAPETMLAERTNPAVHLITVDYTATVQMKETNWSADGKQLLRLSLQMLASGKLASIDQVLQVAFSAAADDPERYFKGIGKIRTKTLKSGASGSGFVVNGDGYLVTARHLVTDDGEQRRGFAREGAARFATDETKGWKKVYAEFHLSDATVEAIHKAMSAYAAAKVQVKMSANVSVVLGVASADGSRTGKRQPAEVVYRSNPDLEADIALVRIRGMAALPTVSLASHSLPQGAPIYLNCFPALPDGSEAARLTPTLTEGRVTSLKPNKGGIVEMQTDAQASPGCSGGAGLDQDGNVVGVLVSGAINGEGASLGQFYLMPIDVVTEALQTRNVAAAVSVTSQVYDQALADYSHDYYSRALGKFQQVKSLYPAHPYVSTYISDCQTKISQGKDKTPPPPTLFQRLPVWVFVGTAGVTSVALMGAVLLLVRLRRRRSANRAQIIPTTDGSGPVNDTSTSTDQWMPVQDWAMEDASSLSEAERTAAMAATGASDRGRDGDQPISEAELDSSATDGSDAGDPDTFPSEDDWAPIGFVPSVPPAIVSSSKPE